MNHRTFIPILIGAAALFLTTTVSSGADVVRTNLRVWLDAGDHNADGVQELGSGTTWRNKAETGATHDATLAAAGDGPAPTWCGNGTVASPFAVQFRFVSRNEGGYAAVANSAGSTPLDTCVFTYEVWARRNGVGGSGVAQFGALITHSAPAVGGNGGINYTHGPDGPMAAHELFAEGGGTPPVDTPFPKSAGAFSADGFHHFVFTRAGDGPTDSAFYLDGVLLGRFKTESMNDRTDGALLTLGGRLLALASPADYFLDCDIAIARIYTAALTETDILRNFTTESPRFGLGAHAKVTSKPTTGAVLPIGLHGRVRPQHRLENVTYVNRDGGMNLAGLLPAVPSIELPF